MVLGHHCGPFLLGTKPSCTVLKITSYKCNISVAYVELKQTVVYGAVQERRVVTQEEIAMRGVENCLSAEWPSVIYIHRCYSHRSIHSFTI